jgi:hypothetical protein
MNAVFMTHFTQYLLTSACRLSWLGRRLIDAAGGLDRYLLQTPDSQLHSDYASELKFQISQVYKQQALAGGRQHPYFGQRQQQQQQQEAESTDQQQQPLEQPPQEQQQ